MANPSVFADVERLRTASALYRAAAGEIGDSARRLAGSETPAMPAATLATVHATLSRVGAELSDLQRQVAEDARSLDLKAWLFEETQRPRTRASLGIGMWLGKDLALPLGMGLLEATERVRWVRASLNARAYLRRVPEGLFTASGPLRVLKHFNVAVDFLGGMNEQIQTDLRDPRLVGLSKQDLLSRGAVRGLAEAGGAVTGAYIGGRIGFLAGSAVAGPIGAFAGFIIGTWFGGVAGQRVGELVAGAALEAQIRGRSPDSIESGTPSRVAPPNTALDADGALQEAKAGAERAGLAPRNGEQCLEYAQRRGAAGYAGGNSGAFNVVFEGNDARTSWDPVAQRNTPASTLKPVVRKLQGVTDYTAVDIHDGDALVWDSVTYKISGGFDTAYGHISVVEKVWKDQILVSEANVPVGGSRWHWYKRDVLDQPGVYILPKPS